MFVVIITIIISIIISTGRSSGDSRGVEGARSAPESPSREDCLLCVRDASGVAYNYFACQRENTNLPKQMCFRPLAKSGLQATGSWVVPFCLFGAPLGLSLSQDVFLIAFGCLFAACGLHFELMCELSE